MYTTAGNCIRNSVFRPFCCRTGNALFPRTIALALLFVVAMAAPAAFSKTLVDLSLEQLATLQVTSVTKTQKSVADAPASVFVITDRDIRSSGATTLPESLRLAPQLQVARSDARTYAITARGFNNKLTNKLLVMIDGRSVYSSLYSGIYWDAQDVMLEDLEQIEVVSGPGGSLWGANAVNGIINIRSRSAEQTQGELISLGGSSLERHAAVRYGGQINDAHYRVYAKHSQHDNVYRENGAVSATGYERNQVGFRSDWGDSDDALTVQGDAYRSSLNMASGNNATIEGANVLARLQRQLSQDSAVSIQAYVDHTQRYDILILDQHMTLFDLELQYVRLFMDRHELMFGGGYRHLYDQTQGDATAAFLPENMEMRWLNVFIQDEIALTDRLSVTLGTKLEKNPYTDWESLPSVQFAWAPTRSQLFWASWSRAVRSPSRYERDLYSPVEPEEMLGGEPRYRIRGGTNAISEVVKVTEIGYRAQLGPSFSWSAAAYRSYYDHLMTMEPNANGFGFHFDNLAEATSSGIELWGSWQAASRLRLHAGLVAQKIDVELKPGGADLSGGTAALRRADPDYYGMLRSSYDVSADVRLDSTLRHVAALESSQVPAYTALDIRLGWTLSPRLELSLVGQNLLDSRHPELGVAPTRSEFERALYGKLVWGL